jgi:energy-coupling factor transporter transmembrane protein EcfT
MAVRDLQDLAACLRVLVTVGLVSAAVGLTELLGGRYVYGLLYGFHPNQEVGEFKLLGTRPLLCFEDPNQIAMWWLTVALAAVILIPGWTNKQQGWLQKYAALALPFVFQGIGASVLTLIGLLGVRVKLRFSWKPILLVLLLLSGLMFAFRGPMLRVARQSARQSGMEQRVKELLRDSSIGSLGWRLVREEEGSQSLETNRWFGWGTVYFWQQDPAKYRPWGFVSLVNGAYGLVGAVMVLALFFAPISYFVFNRDYSEGVQLPFGLTLLWGLHGVDALLNPAFFLPMLFLLGGKVRLFPGIKIPG